MSTLRELALKYGTDKAGHHEYCEAYEFFLAPWRDAPINFIEIGVGGYEFPDRGGEGLRMWREYFSAAKIHGIDVHKKDLKIHGVIIHQVSQDDSMNLIPLIGYIGTPQVIIDDASHINELTLKTFSIMWPMLAPGGIYVIEDAHTSYWKEHGYGGGDHPGTVMNYFKTQADLLNVYHMRGRTEQERIDNAVPDIESIHFFKEIIFIRKKV